MKAAAPWWLAALLGLSACGVDFSSPRAYRCSSDEECRGGWRCLGDSFCHDPALGVATPCTTSPDCAGGWQCLGDKLCHDPALGVTLACVTDIDCAAGWRCLGDQLCHDPGLGVATPCVADGDCAGSWQCLSDKRCHDPALGVTIACVTDAQCTAGWRCLGDRLCHDPLLGVTTPCVADGDCAGGWMCLGDNVCHDPALGIATRCVADADCAGGWVCLGDNVCHDPALGVTTACVVDGDCAAGWRCLGDRLCHDPALGATTPCASSLDCAGGWRCADRICRDPAVGITTPCLATADCLGGWYCGGDRVCRDPARPGAFACANDAECGGGWRCSVQGVCADAALELASVPGATGAATTRLLSPLGEVPTRVRVATPARSTAAGRTAVAVTTASVFPAGVQATTLTTSFIDGGSTLTHGLTTGWFPLDGSEVIDAISCGGDTLALLVDGGVLRAGSTRWTELGSLPGPVSRLSSVAWPEAAGTVPAAYVSDGPVVLFLPDGGDLTWKTAVVDLVTTTSPDPVVTIGVSGKAAPVTDEVISWGADGGATVLFSRDQSYFSQVALVELRAAGPFIAGAWRAADVLRPPGPIPTFFSQTLEYAELVHQPVASRLTVMASCGLSEQLVDFELIDDAAAGPTLEIACAGSNADGVLVYAASAQAPQRLVLERRSLRRAGTGGAHLRLNEWGAERLGATLQEAETSLRLSSRPAALGLVRGKPMALAERQRFSLATDAGFVIERAELNPALTPLALVGGADTLIVGSGAGYSLPPPDGGLERLEFVLEGTPYPARASGRRERTAWIVSGDDALFAGTATDAGAVLLRAVLRPTPGFPIDDWTVRATDAGLEGWLVSNNQLFQVQANTIDRWRATSWPVQGRDVLAVWPTGSGARVGTASGEVLSLPSRVAVAPAWPAGVSSMTGRCGEVLATSGDELLVLGRDGGWAAVALGLPRPLRAPRLFDAEDAVFLADEQGVVLELGVDGGCP